MAHVWIEIGFNLVLKSLLRDTSPLVSSDFRLWIAGMFFVITLSFLIPLGFS